MPHAPPLQSLTLRERRYVTRITSLDPVSLSAAFAAGPLPNGDAALERLAPRQRRYVRAISSMSYDELAAAFGTEHPIQPPAPHR